jgi:hypothetical protein
MSAEEERWIQSIERANISPVTKDQYIRNLATLRRLSKGRSLTDIITHPSAMLKRIEKAYTNNQTRKALTACIKAIFKWNPDVLEKYKQYADTWHQYFRGTDRAIQQRVSTAEPTERELLNWVPWSQVLAKEQELARIEYGSQDHLLLAMYCLIEPIRGDLGHVRLIANKNIEPDGNYIYLTRESGGSFLVLRDYKTSKRYGVFKRELPDPLVRIIITNLRQNPRPYLFTTESGTPYVKKNSFVKFVNRTLERLFDKKFTISLMRHSYISNIDFNSSTPAELFKKSHNMMHSISMQQLYRRQIPDVTIARVDDDSLHPDLPIVNPEAHETPLSPPPPTTGDRVLYL